MRGIAAFSLTLLIVVCTAPVISTYAAGNERYDWRYDPEDVTFSDYSSYFSGYDGCFVLYDAGNDSWEIYDPENATLRRSPDSTYKIYDALFGLDSILITPDSNTMKWDGAYYPFDSWESDQTLNTAMQNSVNWYFQTLDSGMGTQRIARYLNMIGYGNANVQSGGKFNYHC